MCWIDFVNFVLMFVNLCTNMLTWLGYIDGIHGTPYIAAPLGSVMGNDSWCIGCSSPSVKDWGSIRRSSPKEVRRSWTCPGGIAVWPLPGRRRRISSPWSPKLRWPWPWRRFSRWETPVNYPSHILPCLVYQYVYHVGFQVFIVNRVS